MKTKNNNFFDENIIEEIDNKIAELSREATAELGFGNIEEEADEEMDLSQEREQKVIEFIINKEILTKTEISECPALKAKVIYEFLDVESKSELNEEIIELLRVDNEEAFRDELGEVLCNYNVPDELFIKSFENVSDINKPLIRQVSYDQCQTFQDEEYSLLLGVIKNNRLELAQHLINKGAKILPHEAGSLLWNTNISDQLLIDCFKNILDINKPLIKKVNYDQSQTFQDKEYSLLLGVIQNNRLELAQHLINKGAKILPDEANSLLWNTNISDQFLISCFENISDINKPLIRKVNYDQSQTFQDEEYSLLLGVIKNNRLELAQHLINKGAKILPHEANSLLWNTNISDQFLISCFEGISDLDINKPLIRKVKYDQSQTFQDEEYSLLLEVIQNNRLELLRCLINKGAKMLPNEVESFLWDNRVSDQLLANSIENHVDINKPLTREVSYDQGQTYRSENTSLLAEAINSSRLELVKSLVNKGADVNFEDRGQKLYLAAYHQGTKFFEVLTSSGRLLKDANMDNYSVNLDNQTTLNLSEFYDVIMWRNKFNAKLDCDFEELNKWLNDGNIHFAESLFKAYQKFSNIKVNCSQDRNDNFKKAQEKYGKEVISQKKNEIDDSISNIKKYLLNNWEKSLLICKDFYSDELAVELKLSIGEYLVDSFIAGTLLSQEVNLGGEDA